MIRTANTTNHKLQTVMSAPNPNLSPAGQECERTTTTLTEAEKKANHIASEQKRRQAIREGFDKLSEIVPGLEGQARSEGIVLNKTHDYMKKQMRTRRDLIQQLDAKGIAVPPALKHSLESLPPGFLDAEDGPNFSDGSPNTQGDAQNIGGMNGMHNGSPREQSP